MNVPYCSRSFDPSAIDLISHYLKNHITRAPYPESGLIPEEQVYGGEISPWVKFCNPEKPYSWVTIDQVPTLFLFTNLQDIGRTEKSLGIQKNRSTGCGTWHGTGKVFPVKSGSTKIGYYKNFSFRSLNGQKPVGQWTAYEYGISGEAFLEILKVTGWQNQVLCMIRRRSPSEPPLPKKKKNSTVANKRRKISIVATVVEDPGEISESDDVGDIILQALEESEESESNEW